MEYIIRKAIAPDAEVLAMIDQQCLRLPWSKESYYRELTKNKIAMYVVAECGGTVVGYAGVWRVEDEGHITNVAVLPEYQGNRIASALLEEMFGICAKSGIVDYTLEVRVSNAPAICLYEKHGFTSEGIRPKYYRDNKEDAMIMWRRGQRTRKKDADRI
jgi:ribosomal-protein-alanine N-acetyltransferase